MNTQKIAVLLVDDDPTLLSLMQRYLEREFSVTVATSGAAGIALLDTQDFAVVITDRAMPEMPGNIFAQQVKERAPEVAIILISGDAGSDVDVTLFSDFLPKPFTGTRLIEAVKDAAALKFDQIV